MPEDCRWSSWSEWTQCTKTCGKGQRSKSRTIQRTAKNGGKDCVGNRRTTWQCQMKKCPEVAIDYKWSNWAKSGACSKSCGGGTQTWQRTEQIKSKNGGKPCSGNAIHKENCNTNSCPAVAIDCKWSNWEKTRACSKSCGGGTQTWQRTEEIKSRNGGKPCTGNAIHTENCNTNSCPIQGYISILETYN